MAGHTAGLPIQRRRAEHIHQLMAEIADRQHIAAHLLGVTLRATYYFFTLACLTAGLVGLADGRRHLVTTWGVAGVALVVLWLVVKGAERVAGRAIADLRRELVKVRPGTAADAVPATEHTTEPAREPAKEPTRAPSAEPAMASSAEPPMAPTAEPAMKPGAEPQPDVAPAADPAIATASAVAGGGAGPIAAPTPPGDDQSRPLS